MNPSIKLSTFVFSILWIFSCQKELYCDSCASKTNIVPIANAGPDQIIILPTDSAFLDGRQSSDPDGIIGNFQWTKISGPVSINIINVLAVTTIVKNLSAGAYQIELKVTDDKGLSAKDTLQVTVNEPSNHPPVANAGPDQTIILPNTIILDGIGSTDPDNNIADYLWTKIAGPASFNIVNANSLQSQVTNLVEGIYQFELKVTDAEGLFSLDTIVVSVSRIGIATCDISNRPLIKAQLIPYATIPSLYGREANHYKAVAAGNKLIFQSQAFEGVGLPAGYNPYYIFDKPSLSWTLADLSVRRFLPGMAVVGNKVYFAGGGLNDGENIDTLFSTIDIYDAVTNNWTVSSLSRAGYCQDGVTLGDRIFFPSGDVVQIFNTTTNTCTTANLSVPRSSLTPVVADDKVYFAGGYISSSSIVSDRVDVYDNSISHWTTFSMKEPKASFAGIYTNNTIFWIGGASGIYPANFVSAKVQAYNVINSNSTEACLFTPREGLKVVLKNNKIVSFIGNEDAPQNKFDIYDIATNSWSIGILPFTIQLSTIFSDGDSIYVAGGVVNRSWTNQIWKLDF